MIDRLELLLALARERHFGRAALAVGMSQQSLSAGLKQLEVQLGVLLVSRGSRFGGFTPEGERVLDWARRMVADAHAMRAELQGLKHGLTGHLRLAVIPTALTVVHRLTGPYRARFPGVRFTVLSATSAEILSLLQNLEAEAGITYIDNEPLGRVACLPLFDERYCFLTAPDGPLADRASVTWAEAAAQNLCLLTPDMQNRRILESHLAAGGRVEPPALQSNSMLLLLSHVRAGGWAGIMPAALAETVEPLGAVRAIPITDPNVSHRVGLVTPQRDPMLPMVDALLRVARSAAVSLDASGPPYSSGSVVNSSG